MILNNNKKSMLKKITQIMDIYNDDTFHLETFNLKNPKTSLVAYTDGVKGGIIVEIFADKFAIIYFAAIEKNKRRQGHLRRLVNEIKKHVNLVGVNVDFVAGDVWPALGFKTMTTFNMCPTLINISKNEFAALTSKAGGKTTDGITFEDLNELMSNR